MNHFERLIKMYADAPIHDFYENIELSMFDKRAEITLDIDERYFHAGMSAHGSVYFKLLDDAAYFACQSVVTDFFLVTSNFNVNLLRPITKCKVKAIGKIIMDGNKILTASAELFDEKGRIVGSGSGQFVKSKLSLDVVTSN